MKVSVLGKNGSQTIDIVPIGWSDLHAFGNGGFDNEPIPIGNFSEHPFHAFEVNKFQDRANVIDPIKGEHHAHSLALPGGYLYWTDSGTKKVSWMKLDGSKMDELVKSGLNSPREPVVRESK